MDYRKFVLGEEYEPNPLYNKRTKAGRAQPEFVKTTDINHVDDSVDRLLRVKESNNWGFDWNEGERKNFQNYDVVESQAQTRQEAEKLRAQNQSGWEQLGRALSQIAVNEVALGSILAVSDLTDIMINHFAKTGEDDYTNPVSSILTDLQDRFKERMEIYRENPGQALDWHDSGWWWDNFVSVGSTASLLIPSMAITKGLGLIGKGAKLLTKGTKFDRGLYKAGRWMAKTAGSERPDAIMHAIEDITKTTIPSVISRQMEDQLEARETYNEVFDETINKLQELRKKGNEKELAKFFENNPDFINKDGTFWDDNQIARYIADKAATYTFVNDFKYIGFDFLQFNNLLRFGSKAATRGLIKESNKVLKQMALGSEKAAEELLENTSRSAAVKDFLKFYAQNPKIAIKNIAETTAFTEGLEEMGQGITQENAKGVYERYFNPNYTDRTLASQLSDPHLWEQGFWGMAGGIVFKGVGKAGKYGWNKAKRAYYGDKLSDMDIKRMESTEESIRSEEIQSRLAAAQTLEAKLKLWQQGYNPQQRILDKNGNEVKTDFSDESQFEKMADDEKDLVYDNIVNEYLTNMVTSAVDVGNGDLLESFIESEDFEKYIDRIAGTDERTVNLKKKMTGRFKDIKDSYYKNLRNVFGSIDVQSEYLGKAVAMNMTRNEMHVKDLNEEIKNTRNKILSNVEDVRYDNYRRRKTIDDVNLSIGETLQEMKVNEEKYNKKEINKTQYKAREKELQKRLNAYYEIGDIKDQYNQAYQKVLDNLTKEGFKDANEIGKAFAELSNSEKDILLKEKEEIGEVPNVVKDLIDKQVKMELNLAWTKSQLIESQEELEDAYNDMLAAHEEIIDNRFKYAREKVLNYINKNQTPSEAFNNLMQGTAPKDVQEQFDLFKLGNENYAIHEALFRDATEGQQRLNNASESTETSEINDRIDNEIPDEKETKEKNEEKENEKVVENKTSPVEGTTPKTEIKTQETEEEVKKGDVAPETNINEEITATVGDIPPYDYNFMQRLLDLDLDVYHDIYNILFTLSSEERIDLTNNKTDSKVYERIYEQVYKSIVEINKTFDKKLNEEEIKSVTNGAFAKVFEDLSQNVDLERKKKYLELSNAIRNKKNVYSNIGNPATQEEIREFYNKVEELIMDTLLYKKNQVEDRKNILKHNDRIVIDIDSLFEKLLLIYDKETLQLVNPILYYLREDLKSGNQKYEILDSEKIKLYLNDPNKFLQYLKSLDVERKIKDARGTKHMHIQLERSAYRGLKAVEKLTKGNVMEARMMYDKNGAYKVIYNGYQEVVIDKTEEDMIKDLEAFRNYQVLHNKVKNENAKLIPFRFGNSIVYRVYDGSVSIEDLRDEEKGKKWTLGYISTVEKSKDNNTFSRPLLEGSYGLFFEVSKTKDGIVSNFDDIFLGILSRKGKGDAILDLLVNAKDTFTKEELNTIEEYFNLKNNERIKLHNYDKTKGLTNAQAKELLYDYIYNWLIFAPIRLFQGRRSFEEAYQDYIDKMYSNYQITYDLQTQLAKSKNSGEFVSSLPELVDDTIEKVDKSYNIDRKNFNNPIEQIVYIDDDLMVHVAGSDTKYENENNMFKGRFGIVLKDNFNNKGKPAIAWINYKNPLSSNKELYNALRDEIKRLIREAYTKDGNRKNKNGLINLGKQLDKLINKESIFYREKNSELSELIKNIPGQGYNYLTEIGENGKPKIEDILDKFLDGVNINLSIALAKGVLSEQNDVISVDNGKITVKIGDKTFEYNNFADFVLSVGTFKINQKIVSRHDIFGDNQNTIMVENIVHENPLTDTKEQIGTYNATVQLLKTTKEEESISVEKLLQTAGVLQEDIDILLGKNSGVGVIDKEIKYDENMKNVPKSELKTARAYYNPDNKDIYLTKNYTIPPKDKKASTEYKASRYKNELIRLLIHENIHKNFDKLTENEKRYVTNELAKIYIAFGEALRDDAETNQDAQNIIELFKGSNFQLEKILSNSKSIKNNEIEYEELKDIMNEFLAETLSRANIIEYLNTKEYNGDTINIELENTNKKTLWERICELIMNFFNSVYKGFNISNYNDKSNNSIFANEYRLLSAIGNIKTEQTKTINNTEQNKTEPLSKPKRKRTSKKDNTKKKKTNSQQMINFEEEIIDKIETPIEKPAETNDEETNETRDLSDSDVSYNNEDDVENYEDGIILSSTGVDITEDEVRLRVSDRNGDIDNSGVVRVNDMIEFAKTYGIDKVAEFSKLIENGTFTYTCK